jgi:hypothetical protein
MYTIIEFVLQYTHREGIYVQIQLGCTYTNTKSEGKLSC